MRKYSQRRTVRTGSKGCYRSAGEENIPCTVIGNGSNLLVGDRGVCGVVLQIYRNYASIRIEGTDLYVQAGALLGQTAAAAAREGLTGLEFASGIPGTIGGAAAMNAGAYGGEMKDVLVWVKAIDRDGYVRQYAAAELELGYRTSRIQKEALVVLEVKLTLQQGDPVKIRERMEELKEQRVAKQPLEYPSAGSTFKRPEGYFAETHHGCGTAGILRGRCASVREALRICHQQGKRHSGGRDGAGEPGADNRGREVRCPAGIRSEKSRRVCMTTVQPMTRD